MTPSSSAESAANLTFGVHPVDITMVPEEFIAEATGLLGDNNIHELSEERFVGTLVYPVADPAGATLTVREREADPRVTPSGLALSRITVGRNRTSMR